MRATDDIINENGTLPANLPMNRRPCPRSDAVVPTWMSLANRLRGEQKRAPVFHFVAIVAIGGKTIGCFGLRHF